jgi:chemotaxis protein MotA
MSLYTVAGLLVGIGLFIGSIVMSTNNFWLFFNLPSLLLVGGGTLANAFISFQGRYVVAALKDAVMVLAHAKINEKLVVQQSRKVIEWAKIVSRDGLVALEEQLEGTAEGKDPFLRKGIEMVSDGNSPEDVREVLTNMIDSAYARSVREVEILRGMAGAAPAFGMIGTLVGLVVMLDSLSSNPDGIGKGLAVALLTTLYGVLMARLIFQPAADKTLQREQIRRYRNLLMMEGFALLAEERPARYIETRINSMVDPHLLNLVSPKTGTNK